MAGTHDGGSKTKPKGSPGKGSARRNKVVAAATAGAAIGIGSAALVAALLYANRPRDEEVAPVQDPRFEPRES